jgi:hypothetical protein
MDTDALDLSQFILFNVPVLQRHLRCAGRNATALCVITASRRTLAYNPGAERLGSTNLYMLLRQRGSVVEYSYGISITGFWFDHLVPRKTFLFLRISIREIRARNNFSPLPPYPPSFAFERSSSFSVTFFSAARTICR